MDKDKKLNLLYDVTVMVNDLEKNAKRSGIYFVAYNILKELLKSDKINLSLYCDDNKTFELYSVMKKGFSEYTKLKIINSKKCIVLGKIKYNLKQIKKKTKTENKFLKKNIINLLLFIVSIIQEICNSIICVIPKKELSKIDVFLSPVFKTPNIIRNNNILSYTILYDTIPLIFPEYFPGVNEGNHWIIELIKSIQLNDHFFAISENTKKDFIKYANINENHITTTLLAASENFYPTNDIELINKIKNKYKIPLDKKYILSLCTLEPRKNLDFALKNFIQFIEKNNIYDCNLVLAGGHWEKFLKHLKSEIKNYDKYKDKIIITGYIDDEDLAPLYSGAELFVYPSIYEGFGMPPLEAMQCGCPVITSNTSSLPEVVENAGITINPESDQELIEAYERIFFNSDLRQTLINKGIERAKEFSWKKCTDIIIDSMYKNIK